MVDFFEFLGGLAGVCTTIAFLPQVVKVLKTRSVNDISISMYLILCSGILMWIIYGLHISSVPLITANVITFGLAMTILVMKILWNKSDQ